MSYRFRFIALALVALVFSPALVSADGPSPVAARRFYFDKVEFAAIQHGDPSAASLLRSLGEAEPTPPAELSAAAVARSPEYAAQYSNLRARVRRAILTPAHAPVNQWRVDRAEAALHYVSFELEKEVPAIAVVGRWLHDAAYALDHTIFPEMIAAAEAPRAYLVATPDNILGGQSSLLTWRTENATEAYLDGQRVELAGSGSVSPTVTTSYGLRAVGLGGEDLTSATVAVREPNRPTARIQATPSQITRGQSTSLAWGTEHATEAKLDGAAVALQGVMQVSPDQSRSYEIVGTGAGGRAAASTFVTVVAPESRRFIIFFDFDQALIRSDAEDTMQKIAQVMRAEPELRMRVTGHTDARGGENYNINLSERRASAVRDYFVTTYGIATSRLDLIGKGEDEPIAPNTTSSGSDNPEGRQMNRRAEFVEILP